MTRYSSKAMEAACVEGRQLREQAKALKRDAILRAYARGDTLEEICQARNMRADRVREILEGRDGAIPGGGDK